MPRQSALHTLVLSCLFIMQAWLLYRIESTLAPAARPMIEAQKQASGSAPRIGLTGDDSSALASHLNARLSALESRVVTASQPVSSGTTDTTDTIMLDGATALAADRKLEAMLPKDPLSHEELIIFQAQLVQLPADERHQLMAALARAINNGRVRQKLN